MVKQVKRTIRFLQGHVNNWWYAPALALVAAIDLFIIVVPTDALLVSATMLRPKRWIYFATMVSLGSTIGVYILAAVLRVHGWPFLLHLSPGLPETHTWKWTVDLMEHYGDWAVFLVALSPLPQHPAIALAAFAGMKLWKIAVMVFLGRAIKYYLWAYLATHAPGLLKRFIPLDHDLKEVDLTTGEFPNGNDNGPPAP